MNSDILCNPRGWADQIVLPIEDTMKDCLHVAEELVEDEGDYRSELADLQSCMMKLSELSYYANGLSGVMLKVQHEVDEFHGSPGNKAPLLKQGFQSNQETLALKAESEASQHQRFKELEELCSSGPSDDVQPAQEQAVGSGIVIGQVELSLTCPLSKLTMVDPVTNKKCGHSFSKEAIFGLIQQYRTRQKQPMCPIGGCSTKLKEADFQPNKDLEKAIRRKEREKRKGKEKSHNAVVV